jgi:hypothetical protein
MVQNKKNAEASAYYSLELGDGLLGRVHTAKRYRPRVCEPWDAEMENQARPSSSFLLQIRKLSGASCFTATS